MFLSSVDNVQLLMSESETNVERNEWDNPCVPKECLVRRVGTGHNKEMLFDTNSRSKGMSL